MPLYILRLTAGLYGNPGNMEKYKDIILDKFNLHHLIVYAKNEDAARKKMLNVLDKNFSSISERARGCYTASMAELCNHKNKKDVIRDIISNAEIKECGAMIHASCLDG